MSNTSQESEDEYFFLPSEFLTFDDILMDNHSKKPDPPFDFNQNRNDSSRLTELTRHFKLNHSPHQIDSYRNFEKSPQSTLAQFGCFPGRSSGGSPNDPSQLSCPPTLYEDLIYETAVENARLKFNGLDLLHRHHSPPPPRTSAAVYKAFAERVREEQLLKKILLEKQRVREEQIQMLNHVQNSLNFEKQNRVARTTIGGFGGNNEQVAWRSSFQNQENRAISLGGFGNGGSVNHVSGRVKKQSSGTGVFLPRNYEPIYNNSKKSCCLTTPIMSRGVSGLDGHFGNFNGMGSGVVRSPGRTRFLDGFDTDYDLQLAKMKLGLLQKGLHMGI